MMKYTIGYINHNKDVFNEYLGNSILNLDGFFVVLSTSDQDNPAKNYNKLLSRCKTKYLILTHQDISFSKNLLDNIDKTIEELSGNFGALCLVGVDSLGQYFWSDDKIPHEVSTCDGCFVVINTENNLKFDEDIFDDYHLYVEDFCCQLSLIGEKIYTILTTSNVNYNKDSYILHHGSTVSERGFFWGEYTKYKEKFKNKWPGFYTT